jgi:hypothetical protein
MLPLGGFRLRFCIAAALTTAALLASGCGYLSVPPERMAERYFGRIARGEFADATALLAPEFLDQANARGTPWPDVLAGVETRLGTLVSWQLRDQSRGLTAERDGELITLVYEVTYSKHTSFEEISIAQRRREAPRIAGHSIRSPWLSELLPVGEQLVIQYLDSVRTGQFSAVAPLYVKRLRGRGLREAVRRLKDGRERFGPLEDYHLIEAEKHPGRALERDIVLVYELVYANHTRRERFWIKRTLADAVGIADAWPEVELLTASDS